MPWFSRGTFFTSDSKRSQRKHLGERVESLLLCRAAGSCAKHRASRENSFEEATMASSAEKGGNPGVERKPEWPPKKLRDDKTIQQKLGSTALKGASKK